MIRILTFISCLFICGIHAHAQQGLLQKRITFHVEQVSVKQALDALNLQVDKGLAYSSDMFKAGKMVTVHATNKQVKDVLEAILGRNYLFREQSGQIVIYPNPDPRYVLSGKVTDAESNELLIGVILVIPDYNSGTATNMEGFFSLTLPAAVHKLKVYYVGYQTMEVTADLSSDDASLKIKLIPASTLQELVVSGNVADNKRTAGLNHITLETKELEKLPVVLGERDMMRFFQQMPGVQKGNEGDNGMYVRGGAPDQNLVLVDDAVLYNINHFTGLYSLFTGSELKRADLSKGAFSARYGGRLSSVTDISVKDGNRERFSGEGSLGLISSKLQLEGPLGKHAGFLLAGRRTFVDYMIMPFTPDEQKLSLYFYDVHLKVSTDIGKKGRLSASAYMGNDYYGVEEESGDPSKSSYEANIKWGNKMTALKYASALNPRWFFSTSLSYSSYTSGMYMGDNFETGVDYNLSAGVTDKSAKMEIEYSGFKRHKLVGGIQYTRHHFNPQMLLVNSIVSGSTFPELRVNADEGGLYLEDRWDPSDKISVIPGLRLSYFFSAGKTYVNPEPRLTAKYKLPKGYSLAASFSLMNQYVNGIRNTLLFVPIPFDVWVPVSSDLEPMRALQYTLSGRKTFRFVEVGAEVFYKHMANAITSIEGQGFTPLEGDWNDIANAQLTQGVADAYGLEILVRKSTGRFTGWISYTISRTTLRFDAINLGRSYPARYDRPHDLGVNLSYQASKKLLLSASWVYGTGNAISLPVGQYSVIQHQPGSGRSNQSGIVYDYDGKNNYRMSPYHRLDLGIQYKIVFRRGIGILEAGAYNAYNRLNPMNYTITNESGVTRVTQVSLFPVIPSLSFTYKF